MRASEHNPGEQQFGDHDEDAEHNPGEQGFDDPDESEDESDQDD